MKKASLTAAQKILILATAISVTGHLLLISATGLMVSGSGPENVRLFTVELRESAKQSKKTETPVHNQPSQEYEDAISDQAYREETVDLGDRDSPYIPYLKKARDKINSLWTYPRHAHQRHEEGDVVVHFSINKNGRLNQSRIIESSGFAALDQDALDVIRAAAPFHSFPAHMKLSRLHIIATFKYRLDD